jgi:hypothetical protein
MPCKERVFLFKNYRKALQSHSKNLARLTESVRSLPQTEREVLWKAAQYTRERCIVAQDVLQKHISQHAC